jgi:hypothetical protein
MAILLECELSEGLCRQEATAKVIGEDGVAEFMPIDRRVLRKVGKAHYIPVHIVIFDEAGGRALVGLPQETDSGARRLWVKLDTLIESPDGARR